MVKRKLKKTNEKINVKCKSYACNGGSMGCVYGLGVIGSAVYYIANATGFWNGVLGVLKAVVWPAIVSFEFLKFVGA